MAKVQSSHIAWLLAGAALLPAVACTSSPASSTYGSDAATVQDAAMTDTPADTAGPATGDTSTETASDTASDTTSDTTGDAADIVAPDPFAPLTGCLGATLPLTISSLMPYTTATIGAQGEDSGAFVLDFSSTFSSIDLAAFAAPPPATGCDVAVLGNKCTFADFHVLGAVYKAVLVLEDFSGLTGPLRQAGILGTDFLSLHVVGVDYAHKKIFANDGSTSCTASALQQAGWVALSTQGYFEHDLSKLGPYTTVDALATPGGHVPNVPTVPTTVAGTPAMAQLDSGFSDAVVNHSVNINGALFAALQKANPNGLVRDASLDTTLSTCIVGLAEPVQAYHLAVGQTFALIAADGSTTRSWSDATIFVKQTPKEAYSCGGIGTWTMAAAQVGASFYPSIGAIVLDPFAAKV